jgi:hypothetical protein
MDRIAADCKGGAAWRSNKFSSATQWNLNRRRRFLGRRRNIYQIAARPFF